MVYIYTKDGCPRCDKARLKFQSLFVRYTERCILRIDDPKDAIDREARAAYSVSNVTPIVLEGEIVDVNECVS